MAMADSRRTLDALAGYRIGITSSRQGGRLAGVLERHGALVEPAPALMTLSCTDDVQLRDATTACIEAPPDFLVASTGVGMRGWFQAAKRWRLAGKLVDSLRGSEILARGPTAVEALREAGLRASWAGPSESPEAILAHLRDRDLCGTRIVLQEQGTSSSAIAGPLEGQGSEVTIVTVHRRLPARDKAPLFRLVDLVADRELDAVVFTASHAVEVVMGVAAASGRRQEVMKAFRGHVIAACVGPVTAEALGQWGIPVVHRSRLGTLATEIALQLPARQQGIQLKVGGRQLVLTGTTVSLDGVVVRLTPSTYAVLKALARRPGRIISRRDLLRVLPSGHAASEHAVEAAVARLRTALGSDLVQTTVKRGYRLAVPMPA
jgi:uroporphyrinogen-III synthase